MTSWRLNSEASVPRSEVMFIIISSFSPVGNKAENKVMSPLPVPFNPGSRLIFLVLAPAFMSFFFDCEIFRYVT